MRSPHARGILAILAALIVFPLLAGAAHAETRKLKLYFTHTGERAEITFKRNGKYLKSGLTKLNRFLRDHRRKESTRMDPKLFDLIWEAYRITGSREYIHVVSAYRSPATNAMLRRTRGGQASKSQHMVGKAMDFFIPGVSSKKLREIGFKLQGGGVGYYPRSGTPYVHFDTAGVRAWPRMSRRELTRLFPNGRTLHIPPDGKPLPGYKQALADYKRRQSRGQVAAVVDDEKRGGRNLLAGLFRGGKNNSGRNSDDDSRRNPPTSNNNSRPSAPVQPDTPATVLAALPSSKLPTPQIAPRVRTGVPVAVTAPAAAAPPAPAAQPVATPVPPANVRVPVPVPETAPAPAPAVAQPGEPQTPVFAYAPPVPSQRPAVLVAAAPAPAPADRRSAAEIEAALNAGAPQIASAPATGTAANDGAQAILDALSADAPQIDETSDAPIQVAYATLPNPRTRPADLVPAPAAAASAAQPSPSTNVEVAALRPTSLTTPEATTSSDQQLTAVPLPQPQPAPDGRGGRLLVAPDEHPVISNEERRLAALAPGAATTPKAPRPTETDAIQVAAVARPSPSALTTSIDPARFGDWTTKTEPLTTATVDAKRPDFVQNARRMAPDVVFTSGFSNTPPQDANRFTGNAVTFLAVARFDGGSGNAGNGQPLEIQVPATN